MDPAVAHAHQSALRSIARVVEETAPHTEAGQALGDIAKQLRIGLVQHFWAPIKRGKVLGVLGMVRDRIIIPVGLIGVRG